jgi:uncharacterized protein YndB with AHSA1/START domain
MSQRSVKHAEIEAKRHLKADPKQVFAAFAEPDARSIWAVPQRDWESAEEGDDFRVGGFELSRFGPKDDPRFTCETHYFDIVPERRIVMGGTMLENEIPISCSLCTVELEPESGGTKLRVTEQAAFLDDGDDKKARRQGWDVLLDQLEAYLDGQ